MNYLDYREQLGIGICDKHKFKMFKNKINTSFDLLDSINGEIDKGAVYSYFSKIGEVPEYPFSYDDRGICRNIQNVQNTSEIIFKLVALLNSMSDVNSTKFYTFFNDVLYSSLKELKIPYSTIEDKDGIFVFPKGAKELDDALVSQPLEWLSEYPQTRKEWIDALKDYSNLTNDNASDVADKFRKALERFFQEFFNTTKTLENLKSEYGNYMKSKGVPPEISNNLETLQQCYTNFMNSYAKHHDKTSKNVLEYIMYQTGNIIRLLITIEKGV